MSSVCHLTSVHSADDVRIFEKECTALARSGYNVSLIAFGTTDQTSKGVRILNAGPVMARKERMTRGVKALLNKALEVDADVYHLHDPELLQIVKTLKAKNKKVIYDAHEDLPRQIMDKHWIPWPARKISSMYFEQWENSRVKQVNGLVAATADIARRFLDKQKNVVLVRNFPKFEFFQSPPKWETRENAICYLGGIFKTRGIFELLEAICLKPTTLHLAGNYSPADLKVQLTKLPGWSKVKECGFLDREQVRELLYKVKIGVVTLHPTRAYLQSLPVKLFEYMAAGLPVIASDFPEWKKIIEGAQCGICVNPMDPKAIAKALQHLLSNDDLAKTMGERGRKAIEQEYSWETEEKKLLNLYGQLFST